MEKEITFLKQEKKMQQYIMDDRVILAIQGLRSVKKQDKAHSYEIQWNYKGSDGFMDYTAKTKRDKIFDEIIKLIKERENPINKSRPYDPNL